MLQAQPSTSLMAAAPMMTMTAPATVMAVAVVVVAAMAAAAAAADVRWVSVFASSCHHLFCFLSYFVLLFLLYLFDIIVYTVF